MATKHKKVVKKVPKKAVKSVKKTALAKKAAAKKVVSKKPVAKPNPKKVVPVKKVTKSIKKVTKKTPAKNIKSIKKEIKSKVIKPAIKPMAKKETPKKVTVREPVKSVVNKPVVSKNKNAKDIKVPAAKPVVIPKIATKTVRKYQPEFTKSVLDKPKADPGAPIQRYNDTDLNEFKDLILRKLEAAKKELAYLQGLITRKDEMGGDESDNRYMTMEDGSLSMEREQLSQMASRQITFIDHLEKALMRIENKTYGVCRVTGRLIDKARLRAVPHATLSIEAKMGNSK
ncbi:MAG: TraR/DksA C4-type zinc finger protein [Ferruginibacter sp.]